MQKILICTNYDGLYLSNEALIRYAKLSGKKYKVETCLTEEYISIWNEEKQDYDWSFEEIHRNDKALIQLYKEIGDKICMFDWVKFKIVEIPDDVKWNIEGGGEGCGELIREVSRTWN